MEKRMRMKGLLMTLFMGAIMGLVFTLFAQIKNQGKIIPVGIVISVIISIVISTIVGLIIPIKKVTAGSFKLLKIPQDKRLAIGVISALIFDIIFTPPNCIINMWYGMAMGLQDVPPTVQNIFQKMAFCAGLDYFPKALLSTLLIDLVIGFFITFLISPLVGKLTDKICSIKKT